MKTSELIGPALDWAVAKCEDLEMALAMADAGCIFEGYNYSTDWAQGGPIIEQEKIATWWSKGMWNAQYPDTGFHSHGPAPLVAAMRCYVASKLGDEIEIPEELKWN